MVASAALKIQWAERMFPGKFSIFMSQKLDDCLFE